LSTLNIRVGFIILQIEIKNQNFYHRLESRFKQFVEKGTLPDGKITLRLSQENVKNPWIEPEVICTENIWRISGSGIIGIIDQDDFIAEFEISPSRIMQEVEYLIRIASAIWIFAKGGLLIHGAALVKNNLGFLFTGHSGAGKTTVCRITNNALTLNDDLVVIGQSGSVWDVYATPFSNPRQNKPNPGMAPLKSIFKLIQASEHRFNEVSTAVALADLITHIPVMPIKKQNLELIMSRCLQILNTITVYDLYFLPDDRFWEIMPEFS